MTFPLNEMGKRGTREIGDEKNLELRVGLLNSVMVIIRMYEVQLHKDPDRCLIY